MKRLALIAVGLLMAGCGDKTSPPVQQTSAAPEISEALPNPGEISMQDINLYLHDTSPTTGGARKPSFWVNAHKFSMQEEGNWLFKDARAVIYGESQADENIILESKSGTFEEGIGAILEDGVVATIGDMILHLDHIIWKNPSENERGVAYSDAPLTIDGADTHLSADSVRLYPKEKTFELVRVAGSIYVGRLDQ